MTSAPLFAADGKVITSTYLNGTATSYGWGNGTQIYQIGYNVGAAAISSSDRCELFVATDSFPAATILASVTANPWQLFAPQQIIIPTPAAAGYTHPTLSLATATEITATGFKPRVTYTFA